MIKTKITTQVLRFFVVMKQRNQPTLQLVFIYLFFATLTTKFNNTTKLTAVSGASKPCGWNIGIIAIGKLVKMNIESKGRVYIGYNTTLSGIKKTSPYKIHKCTKTKSCERTSKACGWNMGIIAIGKLVKTEEHSK